MKQRGIVLFAHGARDPRWAEPFQRLRDAVAARSPDATVTVAFLEMMTPDLETAAAAMVDAGIVDVTIVPIFFGQGAHLRRDLPERVAVVRERHPELGLTLAPAAGEDDDVIAALADFCLRTVG